MIAHSCLINWFFNASCFVRALALHGKWKINGFPSRFSHSFPLFSRPPPGSAGAVCRRLLRGAPVAFSKRDKTVETAVETAVDGRVAV